VAHGESSGAREPAAERRPRGTEGFGCLSAALARIDGGSVDTDGVPVRSYLLGWASLVVATATVSVGTVMVVRQAVGGGDLVNALSQSQVRSAYSAAGRPTQTPLAGTQSTSSVSTPAPDTTPHPAPRAAGSGQPPGSGSATSPSHRQTGSGGSSHPGGSTPSHSPSSSAAVTRVLTSQGGSVVVRCSSASSSASVYLVSWSPAQGYSVEDVNRGPGQEAEIGFDGDHGSVTAKFLCSSSGPVQQIGDDGGDGGGGGGGGGSGSDGGGSGDS